MLRGDVDAWAGLDPLMAQAEVDSGAKFLYRNPEFNSYNVLNVREQFAQEHPTLIVRVLKAYEKARQWAISNPAEYKALVCTSAKLNEPVAAKVLAGTALGALTGYSTACRRLLDPLLQALRNIPSMAWVPLFILWLGIQEGSKITLIATGVFFPIYLNLMIGILHVDRKLIEVGRVFRLGWFDLIRRVILPASMPAYITGLRSGLGLGWMFVVAAELMGASKGIGYLMNDGQMTGRPCIIIASILLFAICGKVTDLVIELFGRHFLRWNEH